MQGNMIPSVQGIIDAIFAGMLKVSDALVPTGNQLWIYLSTIALVWCGIRIMLESGVIVDVFGDFMRTIFLIGTSWFLLHDGYKMIFQDFILGLIDHVTTIISSTLGLGGSPSEALVNGVSRIIGYAADIGHAMTQQLGKSLDPLDLWASFVLNQITLLFMGVSLVVMLLTSFVYFAIGLASVVMAAIALAFGPICIPFMVLEKTYRIFEGWLNFLISGALFKVVGSLMIGVSGIALDHMINVVGTSVHAGDYAEQTFTSIFVAGVSVVVLYLMWQTPSIANGLLSGNSSVRMAMPRQKSGGNSGPIGGGGPGKGDGPGPGKA